MAGFDYSNDGFYFVTICTKNRKEWFGKIENNKMVLNNFGKIVQNQWIWLMEHFCGIYFDEFIIMPNHFHGILEIDRFDFNYMDECCYGDNRSCRDNPRVVPTTTTPTTTTTTKSQNNHNNPCQNLLSKTINAFKTTSSKLIHQRGLLEFCWQRSFYDHIVRNEEDLNRIRFYIQNNPINWKTDRNNFKCFT
jgi:REP element-mobilizing transposase RayT